MKIYANVTVIGYVTNNLIAEDEFGNVYYAPDTAENYAEIGEIIEIGALRPLSELSSNERKLALQLTENLM